ncbi:MAG: leucine-rich repeat protein [Firmicutes bacterium]|nr:leucine-rich repeat protein [Bacillota bacterium]
MLFIALLLAPLFAFASDFEVDGIYYNKNSNGTTVSVTFFGTNNSLSGYAYSGDVVIPASVTYNGETYSVTSIGGSAFKGCSALTSITIPNSVTSIGYYAFKGCSALTSITIPNSVTSIDDSVFNGCSALKNVVIEDGESTLSLGFYSSDSKNGLFYDCPLETLYLGRNLKYQAGQGYSPFYSNTTLTSVEIGNTVTSIGHSAFEGCSALTSITIPNSVTSIRDWSFYGCSALTSINIPNSVTSIGDYVFYNCSALTSITIPNSVTSIGDASFSGCSALTSINISNSVTSIGDVSFSRCSALTSITIPNSVTSIGDWSFSNCSSLTSITIPNSVTSIGNYVFYHCSALTSITIPNSVTSIGDASFSGCSALKNVDIEDGESTLSLGYIYPRRGLFYDCPLETLYLGRNLNYESSMSPFSSITTLKSVEIGNQVTSIGNSEFAGCTGLKTITVPNSVTTIENYAFKGCTGLRSITLGSGLSTINNSSFSGCEITKAFWLGNTPPKGCENVKAKVNYASSTEYSLDNTKVYQFLISMFAVDGVVYIPVSPSDRTLDVVDYNYDDTTETLTVPAKVTSHGIEVSVKDINEYAFYDYNVIKNAVLSNDGHIGDYAFEGLNKMSSLTIGEAITEVGKGAFKGCSSLAEIVIPAGVASIGNDAFNGCTSVANLSIEDGDTPLTLGSNVSSPLFKSCPLEKVYIGRKLSYSSGSSEGYSPFYRSTSLSSVEISDAETNIYDNEFYGCTNLQSVKIGDGVTAIGDHAFSGCSSLRNFSAGSNVKTIGSETFSGCTVLENYYSYSEVPPTCGTQALEDINKWVCQLYVPASSREAYQAAPQWKDFFFIEEMGAIAATELSLSATECSLFPEDTFTLTATVFPENTTDKTVTWGSSDEAIATVNAEGVVTAVAVGTATITARCGEVEATCAVTVIEKSGLEELEMNVDGKIEVYDLRGIRVNEVTNVSDLQNLRPGVYIIRDKGQVRKVVI